MSPQTCGGTDLVKLNKVRITGPGPAVVAKGRCMITITDSELSGAVGIKATGQAEVVVRRSSVRGTRFSIVAKGRSIVKAKKSNFVGPVDQKGKATIQRNGGNSFR
jgi:hypothetical protein